MENGWRPISDLRAGHYAVGLPDDGYEIDIYRAGEWLLNVATGGGENYRRHPLPAAANS